jgi:uncharacterized protein YprB with RNaseH-like and TPR domain
MLRNLFGGGPRCVHRHTEKDHPRCFINGVPKHLLEQEQKDYTPWFIKNEDEIGYLDIETDGLKVDFSTMLSWCIKRRNGDVANDYITKQELFDLKYDERIVRSCIEEMKKYKILVTYFGTRFDNSFLRAKALHYNMDFPGYVDEVTVDKNGKEHHKVNAELYHFDLFYLVKSKLGSLSRKSLDNVCDYLDIEGKTPLEKRIWRAAKYGDPKSIEQIVLHNKADVEILEMLHSRLYNFSKWTRNTV